MKVLTDNKYYGQIADVIREQNGTNNTYTPPQMVSALKDLFYEEVEGVPPITFQGIGENLLDYRIDGASGGVGERTKNLLKITTNSFTLKGVTFTVNNDKSITCNGTASSIILIEFSNYFEDLIVNNEYIFSGCPPTGSISTYRLQLVLYSGAVYNIYGGEKKFTYKEEYVGNPNKSIRIVIEKDCVCNNLTFYPMMRLASIEDDTYEPYGYKVPVVISGKNLLQNTATSQTVNGVTFTVNEDGSITCNGTASDAAWFVVNRSFDLYAPEGRIASIGNNGSVSTFYMNISYLSNVTTSRNYSKTIHQNVYVQLVIAAGYTCDNLTFYPMIRKADIEDDTYEPYHEPTTTNIYLDEPIEENESISLSDTGVDISTIRGTNVLTVDTTVQPSNVYVKARKESQYETIMRERYEEAQAQLDALN